MVPPPMRRLPVLLVLLAALAALAGCGRGAVAGGTDVRLTVTDAFGQQTLLERPSAAVAGGDTVLDVLRRNARVELGADGTVRAIQGERGRWSFFVNGVRARGGADRTPVRPGDRLWWDRHEEAAAEGVPAVVGSFPEPFVQGFAGERRPTRIECDQAVKDACDLVQQRLVALGLPVGQSLTGTEGGDENLRIVVGRWPVVREDRALGVLERGPRASGVFARVEDGGRSIVALDPRGRPVRRLGPGTGLVATTRFLDQAPTWVVTGTDPAGVLSAARAFDETALAEKYALAISRDLAVPLPAAR